MRLWNRLPILTALLATIAITADPASAQFTINEVREDQLGTDTDEFFEIKGTPSASLVGYHYLVIGDLSSGTSRCGGIESVVDLGALSTNAIQADGLLAVAKASAGLTLTGYDVTGVSTINFENSDNVTHLIVSGFTGTLNQDLDTNDDGVFDVTPWTAIIHCVALVRPTYPIDCTGTMSATTSEHPYCGLTVGADVLLWPGHIYKCPDTANWVVGQFDMVGGVDSPGNPNPSCISPPPTILVERRNICAPLGGQSVTVTDSITAATSATLTYHINGGGPNAVVMTAAGNLWSGVIPAQVNGSVVTFQVVANNGTGMDPGFNQGYFVGTRTIASLRNPDPVTGVEAYRFYGVRIAGTVTVAQGVFSAINTDFWIKDATGGIRIFKFGLPASSPALGDEVTIAGELDQFNGMLELENSSSCGDLDIVIDAPGSAPTPTLISSCQLGEATEGMFIRMEYPFADTTGNNSPNWGANKTYKLHDCVSDTVLLFIDTDTNIDGTPITSRQLGITGLSSQFDTVSPFKSGYQIIPRSLADLTYIYTAGTPGTPSGLRARLLPNAPNPFSTTTTIRYDVAGAGSATGPQPVRINLYDVTGRHLRTLVNEAKTSGSYELTLDASQMGDSPSGIYFYEMLINDVSVGTRKLLVNR